MPGKGPAKVPNDALARIITKALQKEGLIDIKNAAEINQKLALGTASGQDWRVWIENPIFGKGGSDEKPD